MRGGAVVVVTAEDADALPAATNLVAQLELGRLASLEPRRATAQPEDAAPAPHAPASPVPAPGAAAPMPARPHAQSAGSAAVLVRVEPAPGDPPSIRMVVDVAAANVELVFGFILRPSAGRGAKLRSPRLLLDAGVHEVVADLGAVAAAGHCTIQVGVLVGPRHERILWPALLDIELPAVGAAHTAWSVNELDASEMIEPAAVAAHEAAQAQHEQEPREDA